MEPEAKDSRGDDEHHETRSEYQLCIGVAQRTRVDHLYKGLTVRRTTSAEY